MKGITGARGRRRSQHFDLDRRQARIDVLPGLERVGDQSSRVGRIRDLLGKCQVHLLAGQREGGAPLVLGDRETVETDFDLDDVGDPVGPACLELVRVHAARRVDDIGMLHADTVAEELDATTSAGAFHLGRLERTLAAELFSNGRGERVNRR